MVFIKYSIDLIHHVTIYNNNNKFIISPHNSAHTEIFVLFVIFTFISFRTKCRTIGVRNAIKLPNKVNDSSFRCPRCCILQNENDSKFRIEAQKKLTRFAKSILKKQAKGERLTKLQEKFLRKIHQGNRYV